MLLSDASRFLQRLPFNTYLSGNVSLGFLVREIWFDPCVKIIRSLMEDIQFAAATKYRLIYPHRNKGRSVQPLRSNFAVTSITSIKRLVKSLTKEGWMVPHHKAMKWGFGSAKARFQLNRFLYADTTPLMNALAEPI